jgi:hypothetical protein
LDQFDSTIGELASLAAFLIKLEILPKVMYVAGLNETPYSLNAETMSSQRISAFPLESRILNFNQVSPPSLTLI